VAVSDSVTTTTSLDLLQSAIDPETLAISELPKRVWVFGGPVDIVYGSTDNTSYLSFRDAFLRKLFYESPPLSYNLEFPEKYPEWWKFSGYLDLFEFERDACYLSTAIILFLESPGALVELGMLAIDNYLIDRLFVVVSSFYVSVNERSSFINLGPLSRISNSKGKICWITSNPGEVLNDVGFSIIVEEFKSWIKTPKTTRKYEALNTTHLLLLIADLIDLFSVSTEYEILQSLCHFKINLHISDLRKYLHLLAFFSLARQEPLGSQSFWTQHPNSAMCQPSCRPNFQLAGAECCAPAAAATAASTTLSRSGLSVTTASYSHALA